MLYVLCMSVERFCHVTCEYQVNQGILLLCLWCFCCKYVLLAIIMTIICSLLEHKAMTHLYFSQFFPYLLNESFIYLFSWLFVFVYIYMPNVHVHVHASPVRWRQVDRKRRAWWNSLFCPHSHSFVCCNFFVFFLRLIYSNFSFISVFVCHQINYFHDIQWRWECLYNPKQGSYVFSNTGTNGHLWVLNSNWAFWFVCLFVFVGGGSIKYEPYHYITENTGKTLWIKNASTVTTAADEPTWRSWIDGIAVDHLEAIEMSLDCNCHNHFCTQVSIGEQLITSTR